MPECTRLMLLFPRTSGTVGSRTLSFGASNRRDKPPTPQFQEIQSIGTNNLRRKVSCPEPSPVLHCPSCSGVTRLNQSAARDSNPNRPGSQPGALTDYANCWRSRSLLSVAYTLLPDLLPLAQRVGLPENPSTSAPGGNRTLTAWLEATNDSFSPLAHVLDSAEACPYGSPYLKIGSSMADM